jgi:trehalose 6-phosphate synthase
MSPSNRPIVVASNRGPVTFGLDDNGKPIPETGPGGLVTALAGALPGHEATWVSAAMTGGDRAVANGAKTPKLPIEPRFVEIPKSRYQRYYNDISNRVLWFLHHYLWDVVRGATFDDATKRAWDDYELANGMFAEELARAPGDPAFLVQDYHLSLVPRMLRDLRPAAAIAHFSHTPFAGSVYIRSLPNPIRESLLRGLLGADVLGFQAPAWAENFLLAARTLSGARVDLARSRVLYDGRESLIRVYPISVEADQIRELAQTTEVREMRQTIAEVRGDRRLILRVDRLELSKNIVRGFKAFEVFLRRHPNWRKRVTFLALLSPSRQDIPEYREYTQEVLYEAARVNNEFGDLTWQPIVVDVREDRPRAIAAYDLYDVLYVNPVFDGMNLVAMEGPLVNRQHGVLVLSRNAGAYGRLGRYAVGVNPFDLLEQADAIQRALEMPADERARRARGLARTVLTDTPTRWLNRQLSDLERRRPVRRRSLERRGARASA